MTASLPSSLQLRLNAPLAVSEIARVFAASGIRRPVDDLPRLETMFRHANLTVTAWDGDTLIGICRALTDFSYCCYLSDLAVDRAYQRQGVGEAMVELLRQQFNGDQVSLVLLSAPGAMAYYPKLGFEAIDNGFVIRRKG